SVVTALAPPRLLVCVRRRWRSAATTAGTCSAFLASPRQCRSSFRIVGRPKALPRPDFRSGSGADGVRSRRPRERHRRSWTVLVSGVPRSGSSELRRPFLVLIAGPPPPSAAVGRERWEGGSARPGRAWSDG